MRVFVQALYRITLRGIGAIGVLLLIVFAMFVVGGEDLRGFWHPLPIIALSVLTLSSLAFSVGQSRLPDSLARPQHPRHIATIVPVMLVLALVTPIAAMITLTGSGAPDEILRPIAVGIGLMFFLLYVCAGFLGLILSLWERPSEDRPTPADNRSNTYARLRQA